MRRLPAPELFTEQCAGNGLLAIAWPDGDTWEVRLAARDEGLLRYAGGGVRGRRVAPRQGLDVATGPPDPERGTEVGLSARGEDTDRERVGRS